MVYDKFLKEGMGTVLLKGQGNSLFYPRPLHRTPGDIDLWMNDGRKVVVDYARKYCPGVEVVYHHVDVLKEAEIELHFTPSWMNSWRMNLRLQRYFKEWKTLSLLHKVQLPERVGEVAVPTLAMNRVYLLVHIYRHLFDEGIGLRQLLDYHFVLRQPCSEAEREGAFASQAFCRCGDVCAANGFRTGGRAFVGAAVVRTRAASFGRNHESRKFRAT